MTKHYFTDEQSGCTIYAPLGASLIHGTMRNCDLIPVFLRALRDTPQYAQMMLSINGTNWDLCVITDISASEWDERWSSESVCEFCNDLFDVLDDYAPEGYYFGATEGDGSDYGYWTEEFANIQL